MALKHLSSIANDVVQRCASRGGSSVEELVSEFEGFVWNGVKDTNDDERSCYSRRLVEYCGAIAVKELCEKLEDKIADGSFSRFTFDLMLAWETPTSSHHHQQSMENMGKEREDRHGLSPKASSEQDDIPLFYSDIMPLLVTEEVSVGEDAFVWMGSLVPAATDVVNGRFTFETLTATTNHRLHFPAYDKFLREIDKALKQLQKQVTPKGVELGDFEFILHVDGTASSQRVVRHIGGTSWPGRLTLTNYALYFEASGVITYEDALKIDFLKNTEQRVKSVATGPFGAPLFDKAIVYESSELPDGIILEFPEITSSTRRDHWLALTKEILLLHQFLSTFNVTNPIQEWEMHARTILCVVRLHAAKEMLRISPPDPTKFLIFALFDEIPKGDFVLEKLSKSLGLANSRHPCSASSVLRQMNVREEVTASANKKGRDVEKERLKGHLDHVSSLETAIDEARKEEKEIAVAKATTEELKEEGMSDSILVLIELLMPLKNVFLWFQRILMWERPVITPVAIMAALLISYNEWVGKGVAIFLFWVAAKMINERHKDNKNDEIVIWRANDQSTMESIVSAQHSLRAAYETVQTVNISILKLRSVFTSKARKHADVVVVGVIGLGVFLAVIPTKYIVMAVVSYCFAMTSELGQRLGSGQGDRRLREWWDSIPVSPVQVLDKPS